MSLNTCDQLRKACLMPTVNIAMHKKRQAASRNPIKLLNSVCNIPCRFPKGFNPAGLKRTGCNHVGNDPKHSTVHNNAAALQATVRLTLDPMPSSVTVNYANGGHVITHANKSTRVGPRANAIQK